jgi:hypothetical protein
MTTMSVRRRSGGSAFSLTCSFTGVRLLENGSGAPPNDDTANPAAVHRSRYATSAARRASRPHASSHPARQQPQRLFRVYLALGRWRSTRCDAYRALFETPLGSPELDAIRRATNKGIRLNFDVPFLEESDPLASVG